MKPPQQHRPLYESAAALPARFRLFPAALGETLAEKLSGTGIDRDRIRLDGLILFPATTVREEDVSASMSASEVKTMVGAAQVEMVREKLKEISNDWVSCSEFVEIWNKNHQVESSFFVNENLEKKSLS